MWGDISLWFWFSFLWWLVVLSIFLCVYWPSVYILWKNVCLCFLLIFIIELFFFWQWVVQKSRFFLFSENKQKKTQQQQILKYTEQTCGYQRGGRWGDEWNRWSRLKVPLSWWALGNIHNCLITAHLKLIWHYILIIF